MKRVLTALFVHICMALPAGALPTGTVTMQYLGAGAAPYQSVSLYADSDVVYPPYTVSYSSGIVAGYYKHDITAATGYGTYIADPMLGFCIDMLQGPSSTPAVYNVVPLTEAPSPTFIALPMTAAKADKLAELWGRFYSPTMTSQHAAEFQLAVWEIVFETSGVYDIATGSLRSDSLNSGTNTLLNTLNGMGPKANLVALTNAQYQDILTSIQVPAPGAMGLGGLGVAILGWFRARKRL